MVPSSRGRDGRQDPPSLIGRIARGRHTAICFLAIAGLAACQRSNSNDGAPSTSTTSAAPAASSAATSAGLPEKRVFAPSHAGCETLDVLVDGEKAGSICADDAATEGLTVVDLSDAWTPRVFAPDAKTHDAPEYRAKYLELAKSPNADLALFGIAPTISVVADRLADEKRRTCDANIDLSELAKLDATVSTAPDAESAAAVLKKASANNYI
jgi:hypothetical protein